MQVQFIYNAEGHPEAVIIPFHEWEKLIACGAVPKPLYSTPPAGFSPDQYYGNSKDADNDPEVEINA